MAACSPALVRRFGMERFALIVASQTEVRVATNAIGQHGHDLLSPTCPPGKSPSSPSFPLGAHCLGHRERAEALFEELELFRAALADAPTSDEVQVNLPALCRAYVERLLQAAEVIPEQEGSEAISAGVGWAEHVEKLPLSSEGLPRVDQVVTNRQRSWRELKRKPRGLVDVEVTLSLVGTCQQK